MNDKFSQRKDLLGTARKPLISPYDSTPIPHTTVRANVRDAPKAAESMVPGGPETPRWKRAVVPMLRFAAILSGTPVAVAAETPNVPTISQSINQPGLSPNSTSETNAGTLSELQLQGALECFFQPAEADEISQNLASAFHEDTTQEEQAQASGIIHTVFAELKDESKDIAKDLLKDTVEEGVKLYIVLRILDVCEKRLKKRGEDSHNKVILWLASALETIRNLVDKKPEPKSVSTDEVSKALHSTPALAEAALSAALLVRLHHDWVPPQILFPESPRSGHDSVQSHGAEAYRYSPLSVFSNPLFQGQFHEPSAPQAKLIIEKPGQLPAMLTISEAKKALAATFGVKPEAIEITIRG
jgi:hypothetical protein